MNSTKPSRENEPQKRSEAWNEDAQRFESAFRFAAIGMALVSLDGHFLKVNRAFGDLIGCSEAEMLAIDFQEITHPDDLTSDLTLLRQLQEGEIESYRMEKRYRHQKGQWVWALLSVSLVSDGAGAPLYFVSQAQDITAQKHAEANLMAAQETLNLTNQELAAANRELQQLARCDGLTGLKNRRAFDERLHEMVALSKRTRESFSLILLDIDHFKSINDRWGHATGDTVLRELALLLTETLRDADMVARYGGEEFAIILASTGVEGSCWTAERCREAIANHAFGHGAVTASCGVVTWLGDDENSLLLQADRALYAAKQGGRNRVSHLQNGNDQ